MFKPNKILKLIAVVTILTASSCKEPEVWLTSSNTTVEGYESSLLSVEEAVKEALRARSEFFGSDAYIQSRSSDCLVSIIKRPLSRNNTNDTLAYIVNFPNEKGYCLVAGCRFLERNILAVVPNGNIESIDSIKVEPQRLYMQHLLDNLDQFENRPTSRVDPGIIPQPVTEEKWVNDTTITYRGEISNLDWGQREIFGYYCNNGICGCVPLSISMIMAKLERPSSIYINFSNNNAPSFSGTIYPNWKDIKKIKKYYDYSGASSESIRNIGLICRQVGKILDTKYYDTSSPTSTGALVSTLKTLLPNNIISDIQIYDKQQLYASIGDGGTLIIGYSSNETDKNHAWIAEKGKYTYIKCDYYTKTGLQAFWTYVKTEYRYYYDAYMNWGWDGLGNGYYALTNTGDVKPRIDGVSIYQDLRFISIN